MDTTQKRMEILRKVETGEMDLSKASRMLQALEELEDHPSWDAGIEPAAVVDPLDIPAEVDALEIASTGQPPVEVLEPIRQAASEPAGALEPVAGAAQPAADPQIPHSLGWRGLWILPFVLGFLLIVAAAGWMLQGFQAAGLGWGFWFSLFPLALGVLLMWGGWEMRVARWLNVRIKNARGKGPRSISFGFPLPIGLTRWAMQRFGRFSPLKAQEVGDFLEQMDQAVVTDGPMHIFVDDKDGDQVEIWIDGLKNS